MTFAITVGADVPSLFGLIWDDLGYILMKFAITVRVGLGHFLMTLPCMFGADLGHFRLT